MNRIKLALALGAALVVTGCFFDYPDPTVDPATITLNDLAVHDPSVIRADDGSFYVFGSHLAAARSTDLMNWQYIANGVDAANPLWSTIPLEGTQWTGIPGSWAADVIKLKDGKYRFYYNFCGIPPAGAMHRAALVSRRRRLGSHRRAVHRPGHLPALRHDARGNRRGLRPRGVTSYDARIHAEHHRPRRVLRRRRQVVDGLRLVLGRHFHPRNGRDHRQTASRARATAGISPAATTRHRRRLHAVQPEVALLLPVHVVRRPRRERRLQHPHRALAESGRTVPRRRRPRHGRTRAAASTASRRSA